MLLILLHIFIVLMEADSGYKVIFDHVALFLLIGKYRRHHLLSSIVLVAHKMHCHSVMYAARLAENSNSSRGRAAVQRNTSSVMPFAKIRNET